jgi:Uma2 family endonuclease
MRPTPEVLEQPPPVEVLAQRYRSLCDASPYANAPGKWELDVWGRIIVTPPDNARALLRSNLIRALSVVDGTIIALPSVATRFGILVPDVVWASPRFMAQHGTETPFTAAPELCIEVASPSNSRQELRDKIAGYLAAGAQEGWIAYPTSRRVAYFDATGEIAASRFAIDLNGLFD